MFRLKPAHASKCRLRCRLLHIKVLAICSKFGRNVDRVANSLETDQTLSHLASGPVPVQYVTTLMAMLTKRKNTQKLLLEIYKKGGNRYYPSYLIV